MLLAVTKLLAPMLVFTADEAWEHIAHKPADEAQLPSVHMALLPVSSDVEISENQRAEWKQLFELRDKALLQLDALKKESGLNKASEAEVVYHVGDAAVRQRLESYGVDLEDLVGAGFHSIVVAGTGGSAIVVQMLDRRETYKACARSWKRRPDVGQDAEYPDLSLRDAAAVLFTCEQERLEARQSFWLYKCREEITGYGIASPSGDGARQRDLFLEHFPALKGKRVMLFLGRMHEKKGCDLLLRAWKEVLSQADSPIHLVMAGPTDNTYGAEMQSLAQELGLGSLVTWPGMIAGDLKWGCLRSADAFVLPSHQENFGISVVEALACGVPVLISDKVNIWREIENDHAGMVDIDDLDGTTRLLRRWFNLPGNKREEMRTNARICFESRFTIIKTAQALTSLLRH